MASNDIQTITDDIYGTRETFAAVLADSSMSFEREAGYAVQVLSASTYATSVAMKNRQSVVNAITNVAAIGISLNPAKKQAYLVPRDNKICLDISYMGLMDLAMLTGSILWAQSELVYANDHFMLNGYTLLKGEFIEGRAETDGYQIKSVTAWRLTWAGHELLKPFSA